MNASLVIRPEQPADISAISSVTEQAFRDHPHSSHTEQFIIDGLRRSGVLAISLVARMGLQVVGHIAFSPVEITDQSANWYGLGPISVLPAFQGRGIGRQLMEAGLAALRGSGAAGCVLLGEPAFYQKFGFFHHRACTLDGVPPEYFLLLAFTEKLPDGSVTYHPAFSSDH